MWVFISAIISSRIASIYSLHLFSTTLSVLMALTAEVLHATQYQCITTGWLAQCSNDSCKREQGLQNHNSHLSHSIIILPSTTLLHPSHFSFFSPPFLLFPFLEDIVNCAVSCSVLFIQREFPLKWFPWLSQSRFSGGQHCSVNHQLNLCPWSGTFS